MSKDAVQGGVTAQAEAHSKRLSEIVGFNHRSEGPTKDAFAEAIKKLQKKKAEAAEAKAMELAEKAIEADLCFQKKAKEFRKIEEQHVKTMGKTMRTLEALAKGEEPPPDEPEKQDAAKAA